MNKSNSIKAIIFDFNGVFNENHELKIIFKASKKIKANLLLSILSYGFWHFFAQKGTISAFDLWKKVFFTAKQFREKEFKELVEKEFLNLGVRKEMFELLNKIKEKKIIVALLSNSNDLQSKAFRENNFFKDFDKVFLSNEIKKIKPFPSAFKHALKELNISAKECLFVDDQIQNILVAKLLGFKTIWFNSLNKIKKIEEIIR
jgi:putative hydrolase of the HAD superfamily